MNSKNKNPTNSSDSLFRQLQFIFILLTILLLINIPIFLNNISSLSKSEAEIRIRYELIRKFESLTSGLWDAQAGQRGFLISGQKRFLKPYHLAVARINNYLNGLANDIKHDDVSDSEQLALLQELRRQIFVKIEEMQKSINIFKSNGFKKTKDYFSNPNGKIQSSTIRALVDRLIAGEYANIEQIKAIAKEERKSLIWSLYLAFFLDALIVFFAYQFFERELRKRSLLSKSLEKSETEFRMLAETIPQIVWTVKADGSIDYSNRKWTEVTGFSKDEAASWGWLNTVHPDDVDRVKTARMHSKQTKEDFQTEFRMLTKDGSYRWQLARAVPMKDKDGNVIKWFGTTHDIHDYKKALEEAKTNENKVRKIVDSNIIGILFFSLDGRISDCNDAFLNIIGYSRRELKENKITWSQFITQSFHNDAKIAVKKLLNKEQVTPCEKELIHKNGKKVPVMIGAVTQDDNSNSAIAFVLDMTGREKALEAIENANAAKSRFLAMMSHEMRTPLGVISGFADLAMDPSQTASERFNAVVRIKKNAELLTELVNDILDLSKIEANKIELELKEVEVAKFIKDLSESMFIKAKEKGLNLVLKTSAHIPKLIQTDPLRLKQILYNIIGNAIKFTSHGEVTLSIRTQDVGNNSDRVRIIFEVQDSGIGIDEQHRQRLFKPFSQADSSTTRKYGGTGLGLVLSQKLANALGGDVRLISSSRGKGSTFEVSVESIKINSELSVNPATITKPTNNHALTGLNILVVEDSLDIQVLVAKYLKLADAHIDLAENGRVGVQKATENYYDVILMDISMPELDGFRAVRFLRQSGYKRPIIAMSAHAMTEEKEMATKAGFDDYITKPMTRSNLIETIVNHVKEISPRKTFFTLNTVKTQNLN